MLSQKQSKLVRSLQQLATTSTLAQQHSCAVVMGGKVMAVGVNNERNCIKDGTLSQHAERCVLRRCCLLRERREEEA
jgi:tRNA(Arg) A34 adenosine deaminase TadA